MVIFHCYVSSPEGIEHLLLCYAMLPIQVPSKKRGPWSHGSTDSWNMLKHGAVVKDARQDADRCQGQRCRELWWPWWRARFIWSLQAGALGDRAAADRGTMYRCVEKNSLWCEWSDVYLGVGQNSADLLVEGGTLVREWWFRISDFLNIKLKWSIWVWLRGSPPKMDSLTHLRIKNNVFDNFVGELVP